MIFIPHDIHSAWYSAHSASFIRIWPLLRGRGVCISLIRKKPKILKFSLNREGEMGRTTKLVIKSISEIYQIQNKNREIHGQIHEIERNGTHGHVFDFENFKIVAQEQKRTPRQFLESYFSEIADNSINKSNKFPSCFRRILNRNCKLIKLCS